MGKQTNNIPDSEPNDYHSYGSSFPQDQQEILDDNSDSDLSNPRFDLLSVESEEASQSSNKSRPQAINIDQVLKQRNELEKQMIFEEDEDEDEDNQENQMMADDFIQKKEQQNDDQTQTHDIPKEMLTDQNVDIQEYCSYVEKYKQRRLVRFNENDEFDIGIANMPQILYYCYEEKLITEKMMMKIPCFKLKNILGWIKKFNMRELEKSDFSESIFTPFDFRRLTKMLIEHSKIRKYTLGQRIYTIPIEVSVFYNHLFGFNEEEYLTLCKQFSQKYNLSWWDFIGPGCQQKVNQKQKQELEQQKIQEENKARLKKKRISKNQNEEGTKKLRKKNTEKSAEKQEDEDPMQESSQSDESIHSSRINEIRKLVTGKNDRKHESSSSMYNSDMAMDSSISCEAAIQESGSSDQSSLLSVDESSKQKIKHKKLKAKQIKKFKKAQNHLRLRRQPIDQVFEQSESSNKHDIFEKFNKNAAKSKEQFEQKQVIPSRRRTRQTANKLEDSEVLPLPMPTRRRSKKAKQAIQEDED